MDTKPQRWPDPATWTGPVNPVEQCARTSDGPYRVYLCADQTAELGDPKGRLISRRKRPIHEVVVMLLDLDPSYTAESLVAE
jgi:hypothetical protein